MCSAAPAFAQGEVEAVVITGSRIRQPNLTSVSPIQAVSAAEIAQGGRPVTSEVINQLPQAFQNATNGLSSTSNPLSGPGGVATVDLRGLGQTRTLVLVDGRRLGIGDPNTGNSNPSPDINQIPSQLVERIDVVTGGASAVYGSDAIAGVVNFIMKRDFEGVQLNAQFGVYQHKQQNDVLPPLYRPDIVRPSDKVWDGKSRDFSVIMGANTPDDRGNVTAFLTYHDQDPVVQSARDYSACQLAITAAGVKSCAGSASSNLFRQTGTITNYSVLGNNFVVNGSTQTNPPALFNSNAYSYLLQKDTRFTGGFFANYKVNDHAELYADFNYMNDRANVQIAPSGLFVGAGASPTAGYAVNCDNPFLSAQQRGVIGCTAALTASGGTVDLTIGRRNIEGGGRVQFYEHQNYRAVFGTRGAIAGSWKYDLYGSYYYTTAFQSSSNYVSIAKIQQALLVRQTASGPACTVTTGGCVPYNIFQDGGVTPAALSFLDIQGTNRGSTTERIVEGTITGDLGDYGIKSPFANDGVGVAFGFHHRRDHLDFTPDSALRSGDLSGAGGASTIIDNSIRVAEGFLETRVPLVEGKNLVRELSAEGGFRYSDYSTGITAKTYKAGLNYAPTDDVRFRGSYQSAIRAPNILELYTPTSVTNTSTVGVDPCAPTVSPAGVVVAATASLAQCIRTGVTAAQYGNGGTTNTIGQCISNQCAVLNGGNVQLQPEKAKTFSVGFTLTPSFVPGLNASIDYYRIKLTDKISNVPLATSLNQCLSTGNPLYCANIRRAPATGVIYGTQLASAGYIVGTNANLASSVSSGVDGQIGYRLPLEDWGLGAIGGISLNLNGAYLIKSTTSPLPGEPAYDCAGLFGPTCQGLMPKWRHTLRATWTTPWNVSASLAWRYVGEAKFERDTLEPSGLGRGTNDAYNHLLPDRSYVDLSARWAVTEKVAFTAGMNNVFDKDPPLINSAYVGTGLPNTYPTYDLLGRKLFVSLQAAF